MHFASPTGRLVKQTKLSYAIPRKVRKLSQASCISANRAESPPRSGWCWLLNFR